jgi:hypothetical protein
MTDPVEDFIHFARTKLEDHNLELSKKYSQDPLSVELISEMYMEQREMFSRELDDEIIKLSNPDSPWIEARLRFIKEQYETKLTVNEKDAIVNQKIRDYL